MSMLNTPIHIGNLEIKNRLVMPPMATAKSSSDGKVTKQLCDYYAEKSNGGYIGLIIVEHSYISPDGKASLGQLSISDDSDIPGLKKLTDVIHQNGSPVFAQLNHAGSATTKDITGLQTISASPVQSPKGGASLPKEMTSEDMKKVVDSFAKAALRAKQAGFDGVEIHSAHGYLLNQFYSPLSNKRKDDYNGSTIEGRMKLHLEVIQAVRGAVGKEYPISLRLGACDYQTGGSTIEDAVQAAVALEKSGIDLLSLSGGFCGYIHPTIKEQGWFSEISQAVKNKVSTPILLTGGVAEARFAEELLKHNKADLIGVGRAILKDSAWAKNAVSSILE